MSQIANLMLAQQELSYAKKKGLPEAAAQLVAEAQKVIVEAIKVCESK